MLHAQRMGAAKWLGSLSLGNHGQLGIIFYYFDHFDHFDHLGVRVFIGYSAKGVSEPLTPLDRGA